ncbi:MAG: DUF4097 family beta strand repeat-containing protein [Sporolactobacillus sp.]
MTVYLRKASSVSAIEKISVRTTSIDIQIIQTEEAELRAELCGSGWDEAEVEQLELTINHQENQLIVAARRKTAVLFPLRLLLNGERSLSLNLYIPSQVYSELVVSSQSGDLEICQLLARYFEFSSRSGNLIVEDCVAKDSLSADTSSGDIMLTRILAQGRVSSQASSGDVVLKNLQAETILLRTHSGDIHVSNYRGHLQAVASSGDVVLENDQLSGNLSAQASSGDVTVIFNEAPDNYSIDYKGSSGDGHVNMKGLSYEEKSEHRIIGQKGVPQYQIDVRTSSGDFMIS